MSDLLAAVGKNLKRMADEAAPASVVVSPGGIMMTAATRDGRDVFTLTLTWAQVQELVTTQGAKAPQSIQDAAARFNKGM